MSETVEPIELKEFIKQTMEAIESGADIEIRSINKPIDFEVAINKITKTDGGIKLYVASGGIGSSTEIVTRIKFSISPKESEASKRAVEEVIRQNQENADKWRRSF
jgi:hypothetical protein